MPLTYEQLTPALYKQAGKLCDNIPGFQVHELVNACWLMGNIQKLKTLKYAMGRARYDMLDYIRDETGSRNRQRATRIADELRNKGGNEHVLQNHDKPNIEIVSLSKNLYEDGDEMRLEETIPSIREYETENIDTKDLFEKFCRGLSRQESLLLKLYFIEGFTQLETGRVIGFTESRISQMLSILLPRIRIILKNLGYENKIQSKPEKPEREKQNIPGGRNSPLYSRIYYLNNRHKIIERRKKRYQERKNRKYHALAV